MSSVRRALFKEGSNSWAAETIDEKQSIDDVENNSAEIVEYTVVSEGDVTFKTQLLENQRGLKTPQEKLLQRGTSSFYEKDLNKKILIVHEGNSEKLCQTWTELKRLEDVRIESCCCTDLSAVCTKETFLLIFLEMSSVSGHAQKLCSTVRYNPNSLNRSVAIIGVVEEESQEDFSAHGINDFIHLPVTDEKMNQVLLKWAGQKLSEGMPPTPESPEERIPVTRGSKVFEKISGNKGVSSSLVSYSNNSNISPSVQQSCDRIIQAGGCTSTTESLNKQPQLHVSQPVSHNQQPFPSVIQHVSNSGNRIIHNRGFADHTQNHVGLHQPNSQVVSSFTAPQHFVHSVNPYQDHPPSSLFLSRSAPEHVPVHSGVVPGHVAGVVKHVYPREHCSQSYVYHQSQPSEPNRQSPISNFRPVNTPSLYPSTSSSNTGGLGSTHATSSKAEPEQHPASNKTSADCSSVKVVGSPAYMISGPLGSKDMKITLLQDDLSKHSSKERIRRERIKDSCDQLRFLLPSVAGKKSDMASVLELTVKYVQMVKERMPPSVLQEISENIIDTTTVLPRKRANRDVGVATKQGRPRLTPASSVHEGAPRLPHSLQPFILRSAPFQGKAPTLVTSTGPMYVPHLHIRAGYEHMPIPIQQHHQHPSELASFRPTVSPPSAFDPCTVGGTTRSANIMQHLPPHNHAMINLHQECNGPHPFHPKHVYHGNHQTVLQGAAGHSSDMPQQWSFLKLPAIGNIFHSLSPSDLSQGGSKQDSSDSGTPSPADSSSMTPPLWESSGSMISNRQDDAHMQEGSPNMYKSSSM